MLDVFSFDPRNPVFDLPYDPRGGSGILKAEIFGHLDILLVFLSYSWSDTVNGIEVEIEKPSLPIWFEPLCLEEDIYNAMKQEMKFDTLNFITK